MNWIGYIAIAVSIIGAVLGGIMTAMAKKEENKRTKYFKEVASLIEKIEQMDKEESEWTQS